MSGCLLLTLNKKDRDIIQNPRVSFMVKSNRNNGGRGQTHAFVHVLGMEERMAATFLYCHFITVGSWLERAVVCGRQLTASMWPFTTGFHRAPIIL